MAVHPIKTLLIANRGEIAVRIIRSCQKLQIRSIAVYSDADRSNLYVSLADEAHPLGGESAAESYLRGEKIIAIAKATGADAIHPGYGFLAENPDFAEAVEAAGIRFVGPSPATMRMLGHKHSARLLAQQHGLPVSPGYDGDDQSDAVLNERALALGFPLLVKAAAGGGGKGMRRVESADQVAAALAAARREAENFFADGRLILERVFAPARHIEVQLLADMHGNVLHLFERDCSVQRSYQKLLEEAPARALPQMLREQLYAAAVTIGRAVKLHGAATVEFLVATDPASAALPFIFLEVNPRLQVEHPVTEMITGIDIVEQQLHIASGAPLALRQESIAACGHAIEARICAENPFRGFLPTGGRITAVKLPSASAAVRVEHSLAPAYVVTSNYDSLVAKVIAAGADFGAAVSNLTDAIDSLSIGGLDTNSAFLMTQLAGGFTSAPPTTATVFDAGVELTPKEQAALLAYHSCAAPVLRIHRRSTDPFVTLGSWRAGGSRRAVAPRAFRLVCETAGLERNAFVELIASEVESALLVHQRVAVDGTEVVLRVHEDGQIEIDGSPLRAAIHEIAGTDELFFVGHRVRCIERFPQSGATESKGERLHPVRSPLPGKILKLPVAMGDQVVAGQVVAVLESMKMEHSIVSAVAGTVTLIKVGPAESVQSGDVLVTIEAT